MKKSIFLILLSFLSYGLLAHDLDSLLNQVSGDEVNYADAAFKSTHVINGQSVMQMHKNHLDFRIEHRFGLISDGIYNFFGLDQSSIRLTLDYALTDWLTVGIGRSSFDKTYDGSLKFRILRQSTGKVNMPISLSFYTDLAAFTRDFSDPTRTNYNSSRLSFVNQILVARKFTDKFSLQLSPTMVHRNLAPTVLDPNDIYSLGIGGRYKITKRMALTAEYFYSIRPPRSSEVYHDPIAIGIDIETGGHVFQIMLTNSPVMFDSGFITGTHNENFFKGDIHLGFNISRIFSFQK